MTTAIETTPKRTTAATASTSANGDSPHAMFSPTDSNASTSSDLSAFTPPTSHIHSSVSYNPKDHGSPPEEPRGGGKGVDVRDALATCEDPALGWSMQFWVTIADPLVCPSPT